MKKGINTKDAAYFIVIVHDAFYGMMKGLGKPPAYQSPLTLALPLVFSSHLTPRAVHG